MCGICEKAFDCPSKLQRHQNTHAGIRPYKCEVCGKALSRPEHLKRHLMTHDPDKVKPQSYKSKSKSKSKSTVSTSAHAILSQATLVQAQALQHQQQQSVVAAAAAAQPTSGQAMVVSRVKQETDDQQVLTCQVLQQDKIPPLAVVATTPTLDTSRSQQQQPPQPQQYIMAATAASQQQQQQQQQLLQVTAAGGQASVIPWSQVAVGGTATQAITINATMPMAAGVRALEPQLVATTYSPHVAVLHNFAFGAAAVTSESSGAGGDNAPATVMYQRAPVPANMIVNAAPSSVCGPPVFPPITEMR